MVGASVTIALIEGGVGHATIGIDNGEVGAAAVEGNGETGENLIFVHDRNETMLPHEVESEVVEMIAYAKDKTSIEATHVLERTTIEFVASDVGIVVDCGLGESWGDPTIPALAEHTYGELRSYIEIEETIGHLDGEFPTPTHEDGDLETVVVVIGGAEGLLKLENLLNVCSTADKVGAELEIEVVGPEGRGVGKSIVDIGAEIDSHDGRFKD